jgi:hypothetical protein
MTRHHAKEAALTAMLLAVLLLLYVQVDYYVRHYLG